MTLWAFAFVIILFIDTRVQAAPVLNLEKGKDAYGMGKYLDILEDPSGKLSIEDVRSQAWSDKWKHNTKEAPNYGASKSVFWVRFNLKNPFPASQQVFVKIGNPYLDYIDVYSFVDQKLIHQQRSGDLIPFHQRSVPNRHFVFSFLLEPSQTKEVYIRNQIIGMMDLPMMLYTDVGFIQETKSDYTWYFFYIGVILSMLLYNLFLYFSIREPTYIFYVLFLAALLMANMSANGLGKEYLWPWATYWGDIATNVFLTSVLVFSVLFFRSYLNIRKNLPEFDKPSLVLIAIVLFLEVLSQFIKYPTVKYLYMMTLPWALMFISAGILAWKRRVPAVHFYLFAWTILAMGGAIRILKALGVFPSNFFTENSVFIASIFEVLLFSFGLGDKINQERKAKFLAQQKTLEMEKQLKNELENLVDQRTEDLNQAMQTKDKFFSIIAHDLRGPIGNISFLLKDLLMKKEDPEPGLVEQMQKSSENAYELLENLLTWARGQKGQIESKPGHFPLITSVKDTVDLLQSMAAAKSITIQADVPAGLYAFADESMVRTIVRNLLNNAIKFSPDGSRIDLYAVENDHQIRIDVRDYGRGIDEQTQKGIFSITGKTVSSPGTNNEKGTGLGLILCREFVRANGGEIGLQSVIGQGTTFWFTLPCGQMTAGKGDEHQDLMKKLQKMKILVVEDNELNLRTIFLLLNELKLSFTVAQNGSRAVRMIEKNDYDLILMDVDIPILSGIEVSKIAKKKDPDLLIVAVTSYDKQDLRSSLDQGILDAHLKKPFEKELFLNTLLSLSDKIDGKIQARILRSQILTGKSLLVVDDSSDFHMLVEKFLQSWQLHIRKALSAQEAFMLAAQKRYDLILLDLNLPDYNGFEILNYLRDDADSLNRQVPVLAVTASDSLAEIEAISNSGFDGYIRKPIGKESIALFLSSYL